MPRAVRPASGNVADSCLRQWVRIADAVEALPDRAFEVVTRLPGWRVRELVAHLVARAADIEDVGIAAEPVALKGQLRTAVGQLASSIEGGDAGEGGEGGERLVATRFGDQRFADFIVTRCIEGVVHGLDLAAALPGVVLEPDPAALKITAKALLGALATLAPGKSVEVRVPPVAAVQCVEGPRHTRGTPPNVVETDPISWIELAAGRLAWSGARDDGRLRASGERSDISALLPLL